MIRVLIVDDHRLVHMGLTRTHSCPAACEAEPYPWQALKAGAAGYITNGARYSKRY